MSKLTQHTAHQIQTRCWSRGLMHESYRGACSPLRHSQAFSLCRNGTDLPIRLIKKCEAPATCGVFLIKDVSVNSPGRWVGQEKHWWINVVQSHSSTRDWVAMAVTEQLYADRSASHTAPEDFVGARSQTGGQFGPTSPASSLTLCWIRPIWCRASYTDTANSFPAPIIPNQHKRSSTAGRYSSVTFCASLQVTLTPWERVCLLVLINANARE